MKSKHENLEIKKSDDGTYKNHLKMTEQERQLPNVGCVDKLFSAVMHHQRILFINILVHLCEIGRNYKNGIPHAYLHDVIKQAARNEMSDTAIDTFIYQLYVADLIILKKMQDPTNGSSEFFVLPKSEAVRKWARREYIRELGNIPEIRDYLESLSNVKIDIDHFVGMN